MSNQDITNYVAHTTERLAILLAAQGGIDIDNPGKKLTGYKALQAARNIIRDEFPEKLGKIRLNDELPLTKQDVKALQDAVLRVVLLQKSATTNYQEDFDINFRAELTEKLLDKAGVEFTRERSVFSRQVASAMVVDYVVNNRILSRDIPENANLTQYKQGRQRIYDEHDALRGDDRTLPHFQISIDVENARKFHHRFVQKREEGAGLVQAVFNDNHYEMAHFMLKHEPAGTVNVMEKKASVLVEALNNAMRRVTPDVYGEEMVKDLTRSVLYKVARDRWPVPKVRQELLGLTLEQAVGQELKNAFQVVDAVGRDLPTQQLYTGVMKAAFRELDRVAGKQTTENDYRAALQSGDLTIDGFIGMVKATKKYENADSTKLTNPIEKEDFDAWLQDHATNLRDEKLGLSGPK